MKNFLKTVSVIALLTMSVPVFAEQASPAPAADKGGMMMCPMMGKMDKMHKDMGDMMKDMHKMMDDMSDPAMKERMKVMHDKMTAMMEEMKKNHESMMMAKPEAAVDDKASAPAVSPEDHKAHHPDGGQK